MESIELIINGSEVADTPLDVANSFNTFFTTLSSNSTSTRNDSVEYINKRFHNLKKYDKHLSTPRELFTFQHTTTEIISSLIKDLNPTSDPGISEIPSKVIKACEESLSPIFTNIFNAAISLSSIPTEWKSAVITPLYKKKGDKKDINNYRGISVLPPIAKIFEKILSTQITAYGFTTVLATRPWIY